MKITCVKGSPRKNGNSSFLADYFLEKMDSPENEIKTFNLNQLNYRGCQGCKKCLTDAEKCIMDDDMQKVLESVRESDILVLASGVYYGDITSQAKGFIDRIYSYYNPNLLNPTPSQSKLEKLSLSELEKRLDRANLSRLKPGKHLIMILAQRGPENRANDIFPKYTFLLKVHGFSESHLIRACGVNNDGDVKGRKDVLKQVENVAEDIFKRCREKVGDEENATC